MSHTPAHAAPAASVPALALIGFGEAGETFASAAGWDESHAGAYDLLPARRAHARELGLGAAEDAAGVLAGAELVLCLVTADQVLDAARACAPHLAPGTLWCDGNSVAPGTKRAAAAIIEAAGGIYVDVAILAPVNPARLNVPLLLAGAAAGRAQALLSAAGFANIRVVGEEIGRASAIKMIRSVMVKGVEALTAEMMLGAQQAGVVEEVLASLDASEKPKPWAEKAAYNIERMVTHGARRAAEMEESAKTLEGLGIEALMTRGTVARQREMAGRKDRLI
jgi:3-hydroxyisobutyrate dehydrogenase-like beta-hydroxyacid dehydrogenase